MCSPSGIRGAGTAHEPHRHVFSTRLRTPGRHADDPPLYSPAPSAQAAAEHEIGPWGAHRRDPQRRGSGGPDRRGPTMIPGAGVRQAWPMTTPAAAEPAAADTTSTVAAVR